MERKVRFGAFEFDPFARELKKHGVRLKVQEQPLQILVALLEHAGETVPREELQRALWPEGTFVEYEQSLNKAVNKLREALGDSAGQPLYIETLARRGYRFVAPVETASGAAVAATAGRRKRPTHAALVAGALVALAAAVWVVRNFSAGEAPKVVAVRQLTHDGRMKLGLVTDGSRIYFSYADGSLAEVSAAGGEPVRLPIPLRGVLADLSRDAKNALFFPDRDPYAVPLWIVSLPDGSPRRVGDVRANSAAWSPDGRLIAAARDNVLETCNPDGSGVRRLAEFRGSMLVQPRWSPDRKVIWLAALALGVYQLSVWEVDSETGARREVLPASSEPLRLARVDPRRLLGGWAPDGSYLLIAAVDGGRNSIWAVPRGSGRPVQVTFGPVEYWTPTPSPDGKSIFAIGGQRRGEVMRWDAHAREFVRLGAGLSADGVEFSPDGHWIAWAAYPEGSLWRSRPDGSERLELIAPPSVTYLPRWSPDGQRIAVMVREPGAKWKIRIVPAHGGSAEILLPGAGPEADPNWSPDGRKLVYAPFPFDVPAGQAAVHTVDMDTRLVTRVPGSEGLFSPRWSPDGRYIAAVPNGGNTMELFELSSRRWRTLVLPAEPSFPLWSRDGRYVHVGTPSGAARIRVSDGSMEIIAPVRGIDLAGNMYFWTGLDAGGAPMILRDLGNRDIYELQLAR